MNTHVALCTLIIGALAVSNGTAAAETRTTAVALPVAQVSAIKARSGKKVSRFTDTNSREFAVAYDHRGHVSSVMATKQRHIADILSVGYMPDGRIANVLLGNGDMLFYSYGENGSRRIHDRSGNSVDRTGTTTNDSLASTVARMDALFKALGQ